MCAARRAGGDTGVARGATERRTDGRGSILITAGAEKANADTAALSRIPFPWDTSVQEH